MALAPGTRLGPYTITAPLGAGGMGEVYKATDSRLERTVAIKVLPEHVASDPEMKRRFEREAKTISSLNHPHICTLYDVGSQDGIGFLVMEYLEGETLAQRLTKGALPLEQALRTGIEIADALDKAHRQGIVHRDLKPGNIMLTKSGAKLLDFGLAKLRPVAVAGSVAISAAPTMSSPITGAGSIVGTFQYMAPEQLEGQDADARTDIFAFGAVLYEMLTGKKAFEGQSQASLIAAIMHVQPAALTNSHPMIPLALDRVVARCLAKDPEDRWQSARDLGADLRWIAETSASRVETRPVPTIRGRSRVAALVSAAVIVTTLASAVVLFLTRRDSARATQVRFILPTAVAPNSTPSVSPDGRWIAYVAMTEENTTAVHLRDVASTEARPLPGTEGATGNIFWSGDSQQVGFNGAGRGLRLLALSGGPARQIHSGGNINGVTTNADGLIVLSLAERLYRLLPSGSIEPITDGAGSSEPLSGVYPSFLPDGRRFLYLSRRTTDGAISVGSIDSSESRVVLDVQSQAAYVDPGYLLFVRDGTLFAQRFDAGSLSLGGEPLPVAERVEYNPATGSAAFAASRDGVLVYRSGASAGFFQFTWFDRSGTLIRTVGRPAPYRYSFDLAPDGERFVVSLNGDLWVHEFERDITTRLTQASADENDVVWAPDGSRVAFSSSSRGQYDLFEVSTSGTAEPRLLVESDDNKWVEDWSRDGRYVVYLNTGVVESSRGLYVLPLFGDRKPFPIVANGGTNEAHFSPDGRWLAYDSSESGTWQIEAVSFPTPSQKRQISTVGGVQPRWRADGGELYYLGLDGRLMAVDIQNGPSLRTGSPKPLFDTHLVPDPTHDQYVVSADGQRFLVRVPVAETAPVTVVVNWLASLAR